MPGKLLNIPTSLIMGFLGVGKTSAILNLLEQKPAEEKWAVLVNEFGAVGIDGAIYKSHCVNVKEVPGGCMCCAASVPLQVAVNSLLKEAKPDRLLIEPTGLGHPKRVLDTLSGEHFSQSLSLRANICLVDPSNLKDPRYTEHETFNDQIAMSDILVANKTDLADAESMTLFEKLASQSQPPKLHIAKTQYGKLDATWLDLVPERTSPRKANFPDHHESHANQPGKQSNDGFQSTGWVYPPQTRFDFECIKTRLQNPDLERAKGVLATDKGRFIFNASKGQLDITQTSEAGESRLELIAAQLEPEKMEASLNECKLTTH